MKTELLVKNHLLLPGHQTVEIWYNGKLIGTITGADNEGGIRIVSKHKIEAKIANDDPKYTTVDGKTIKVAEILIKE